MKFKLFKADGSPSGDVDIKSFPTLEEGKGVDALRQAIIAVHAAPDRSETHLNEPKSRALHASILAGQSFLHDVRPSSRSKAG